MKKILYILIMTAGLFSCEKGSVDVQPVPVPANDKIQVTFTPSLTETLSYDTEMTPMTRAGYDRYLTGLNNKYRAVIIKYTDQKWIVDTVLENYINTQRPWQSIIVSATTQLSPIVTELRPGIYKMGLFINFNGVKWNSDLKKGYVVSSEPDILPTSGGLPAAYTVEFADKPQNQDPPEGSLEINRELFAGMTSFTVEKNNDLHAADQPGNIQVKLQRQVSRYRFLLRLREKDDLRDFPSTNYWFTGNITCNEGERFCDGINLLGGPFYNENGPGCTSMPFYACTSGNFFRSPTDNRLYFLSLSALESIPPNINNSTNYAPFLLTDNTQTSGISCKIENILISGQSGEAVFKCNENLDFILKPNSIIEKVFEVKIPIEWEPTTNCYTIIHPDDPNEGNIFPPFYEWNAVKTEPETQNP